MMVLELAGPISRALKHFTLQVVGKPAVRVLVATIGTPNANIVFFTLLLHAMLYRQRAYQIHMPNTTESIRSNIAQTRQALEVAAKACGRDPNRILLLAVSKKHGADAIQAAYDAGVRNFGESYCQEALEKIEILQKYLLPSAEKPLSPSSSTVILGLDPGIQTEKPSGVARYKTRGSIQKSTFPITWHFIGPIQSNKTKDIAEHFDWVHSVSRLKTAERLSAQRPTDLPPLHICLQVNIDSDPAKQGFTEAEVLAAAGQIAILPGLNLRGLMCIPAQEYSDHPFERLAALQQKLIQAGLSLDTLSMGMTRDFEDAIEAGSTIVRVGTGIFGVR
jgi:pyridoxal phosphate enzyme (YggS family)